MTHILVGKPDTFAIESSISKVSVHDGQIALGYFVVYIDGCLFGVREDDATMLGNSYGEINKRIKLRGQHIISMPPDISAREIASSYLNMEYARGFYRENLTVEYSAELENVVYVNSLLWAPDGDEAFDDGSHIIQIDYGNDVRLIAFKYLETEESTLESVIDKIMPSEEFYGTLSRWKEEFDQDLSKSFGITVTWCN